MHSRIFRIISVESETPTQTIEEVVDCWDSLPGFIDYVRDCSLAEFEEDIEWLLKVLDMPNDHKDFFIYNKEDNTIEIGKWFKGEFFEQRLDKLKEKLNEDDAVKRFAESSSYVYELKDLIEDEYGFKVMDEYNYLHSFDEFVRYCQVGAKYKIVQIADYHW